MYRVSIHISIPVLLGTSAAINLFENGGRGPVLGSTFGIPGENATFDYVVVGGGTAGIAIATRLSSAPGISVALVEAGGFYEVDNGNLSVVPAYAPEFTGTSAHNFHPLIDWGFVTEPQAAIWNRTLHYARGKTFGGSSARNYMLYQRQASLKDTPEDPLTGVSRATVGSLQVWADAVDDQSYTWDKVLPYYKKSAQYTPSNQSLYTNSTNRQDPDAFSPTGGPLQVSSGGFVDGFSTWAQKVLEHAGMKAIPGFNSGRLIGSAYSTFTIDPRNSHRSSSEASFLQTAIQRQLAPTLYHNTQAQRILFNGTAATGVLAATAGTFGTPGVSFTLSARREVIVSAGAFQSPQLLMVSGIGPCDHLAKFSIPCLIHSPGVGQNMWDHPLITTAHRVRLPTTSALLTNATLAALASNLYTAAGAGPLSIQAPGLCAWEKLPAPHRARLAAAARAQLDAAFPHDWPELEWLPNSAFKGNATLPAAQLDPRDGAGYASIGTALVAPLSRGSVRLRSASMRDLPRVDPRWLSAEADRELVVQAVARQREVWRTLAEWGVAEAEEVYPGRGVATDGEVLAWVGRDLTSIFHASCTCKMGVRERDGMAVVDAGARVFGASGLRVVDASAFPVLVPGHPQATVYMLAEKIADDILKGLGLESNASLSVPLGNDDCEA